MSYQGLKNDLNRGAVVLMDGATGTELQRRGIRMDPEAWCGTAALQNAAALEAVHRDYLAAGARLITANTFATSRVVLNAAGLGARFDEINRVTLDAARVAAADYPGAVVAGSLSHMIPDPAPAPAAFAESCEELASTLKQAGCDVILLEMMFAPERMEAAFAAAIRTGLPVWAGFSVRRGKSGGSTEVLSFAQTRDIPFAEILAILKDQPVDAAGIMHSEPEVTGDALAMLRGAFDGPLTAYPDSGHMTDHNWHFDQVIAPAQLHDYAVGWIDRGAQVLGGCCGLGVAHVAALAPLQRPPTGT